MNVLDRLRSHLHDDRAGFSLALRELRRADLEALLDVADAAEELVRLPIAKLDDDTFDAICELQIALAPLITEGDAR